MNSLEHNKPWPFDPIPDLEEIERERRDKYPFGRYDKVFMKVPGVKVDDVENWSREPPSQLSFFEQMEEKDQKERLRMRTPKPKVSTREMVGHRTEKSYLINLNDQLIALFKVEGKIYAIKDSCPHAGGPLSVGDIEEIPGAGVCVRCPWHQWKIQLKDGNVREPFGRKQQAVVYPVNITSEGDIYIGFDSLSQKFFNLDLHPGVDPRPKPHSPPAARPPQGNTRPKVSLRDRMQARRCLGVDDSEEVWENLPCPSLVYLY